jgi:hypothetical protein
MLTIIAVAGIEIILVACWIGAFALDGGTLGSPHQAWYVEIPLMFIVLPVVAITAVNLARQANADQRFLVHFLFVGSLVLNMFAFLFYIAMSGGGV